MTHPAVTIRPMAASANPDRAIARIARAQRGLITAQQARDAGLSMDAVRLDRRPLAKMVDDALSRRLVTPQRLRMALDEDRTCHWKGVDRLRDVVLPWLDAPELESVAEAAFLRALTTAGLPAPAVQYPVCLRTQGPVRLDFAWPERMVAVEIDGFRWHADPESHAHDSTRANALAAGGWTVLRATPTELRDRPSEVITALRRRL
jgi:hypothetical protein